VNSGFDLEMFCFHTVETKVISSSSLIHTHRTSAGSGAENGTSETTLKQAMTSLQGMAEAGVLK
jgi:hypothetical protein